MATKSSISSNGKWASAILMLLALLWLSVSTPFVYAAQQKLAAIEKGISSADDETNPLAGTNEEKSESGVYALSEYLHETMLAGNVATCLVKYEKCHPSNLYFAYHPELHSPPPNSLG
ncbi:hypothetical protein SAMN05444008_1112 [Cnuella takakiae]|uniref:Uncharacterized protein n=1 Tax=Cnuella takakiae TaxID=1302690 RepID=A0A1M5DMN2_9BACT|nr:hypothetical protein [Cnuella takakiae]OLY93941.1 hypothetical protein BUE76_20195 [Cnuella takakiae]SHF68144.1 hypothetical protein SAMN05444008_1112 [Cnuella takakiae]